MMSGVVWLVARLARRNTKDAASNYALVTSSFLLLVVMSLLLVAMLLLVFAKDVVM